MTWQEAKDSTIQQWITIQSLIGCADTVELLTEINAVCDLCDKSEEVAGTPIGRCQSCLFLQQFGGCREVSAHLSELVVSGQLDEVRALVEGMIRATRRLQVPEEHRSVLPVLPAVPANTTA